MIAALSVSSKLLLIAALIAFAIGAFFAAAPKTRNSIFYIALGLALATAAEVVIRL